MSGDLARQLATVLRLPLADEDARRLAERLRDAHAASHLTSCDPPVTLEQLVAHVLERAPDDDAERAGWLASFQLEDLALALACARGSAAAIRQLEVTLIDAVPRSLAHQRVSTEVVDEIRQELRSQLLVGGGRPKLLDYRGRGPLGAWVRVVTVRLALDRRRSEASAAKTEGGRHGDSDPLEALADVGDSPELAFVRDKYAGELRVAFAKAVRALSTEDRAILRGSIVDALTVDQIGALYQVHRATAARWVARARSTLLAELQRELATQLGSDHATCLSIVRLVRSRVDLSLERVLGDAT